MGGRITVRPIPLPTLFSARKGVETSVVSRNSIRTTTRKWSWLFIGPVVAAFIIGFVWPFFQGIYLSFCKFKTISSAEFIGLEIGRAHV